MADEQAKHSAVIAAFGEHFAKPGLVPKDLHRALLRAQRDRLVADYTADSVDAEAVRQDISAARDLIEVVRKFLESDSAG